MDVQSGSKLLFQIDHARQSFSFFRLLLSLLPCQWYRYYPFWNVESNKRLLLLALLQRAESEMGQRRVSSASAARSVAACVEIRLLWLFLRWERDSFRCDSLLPHSTKTEGQEIRVRGFLSFSSHTTSPKQTVSIVFALLNIDGWLYHLHPTEASSPTCFDLFIHFIFILAFFGELLIWGYKYVNSRLKSFSSFFFSWRPHHQVYSSKLSSVITKTMSSGKKEETKTVVYRTSGPYAIYHCPYCNEGCGKAIVDLREDHKCHECNKWFKVLEPRWNR